MPRHPKASLRIEWRTAWRSRGAFSVRYALLNSILRRMARRTKEAAGYVSMPAAQVPWRHQSLAQRATARWCEIAVSASILRRSGARRVDLTLQMRPLAEQEFVEILKQNIRPAQPPWAFSSLRGARNDTPMAQLSTASASISVHQRAPVQVRHECAPKGAPNVHQ